MRRALLRSVPWVAAAALVVIAAAPVRAASILSLLKTGPNQASDEDREYLIDRVTDPDGIPGTGDEITDPNDPNFVIGQLDVGDSFRGLININTMNSGGANVGGTTGNNELSGVFQVLITGKIGTDVTGDGIPDQYTFTFAPDPAFAADLGGGIVTTGFVPGPGAIAVLFEDPTPDYANDFNDPPPAAAPPVDPDGDPANGPIDDGAGDPLGGPRSSNPPPSGDVSVGPYLTEEAFIATASDGLHFATLGWLGPDGLPGTGDENLPGPGEGAVGSTIAFSGFDNVLSAFGVTSGTTGATSNFGLSLLALGPHVAPWVIINKVTPSPFGLTDFALSQGLKGVGDLDTPFEVASNTNLSFNATIVPEPATMILMGTGLLGIGAASRRRRKKA